MASPYTLDDSIRVHRKALMDWLGGLHVDYGTVEGVARNNVPVLRVFATPDRAVAAAANLLIEQGWITKASANRLKTEGSGIEVLPLPLLTISEIDPIQDAEFAGVQKVGMRYIDRTTGKVMTHPAPGHYKIDYTITAWSMKQYTMSFIREWFMSQFGVVGCAHNERLIPVTHKAPWGVSNQSLKFSASADLSDLEGENPRYMRVDFTVTLRAWIPKTPVVEAEPVEVAEHPAETEDETSLTGVFTHQSANHMYATFEDYPCTAKIAARWPREGNATVESDPYAEPPTPILYRPTLKLGVAAVTDKVTLVEGVAKQGAFDHAIFSARMQYRATQPFKLHLGQWDASAGALESLLAYNYPSGRQWHGDHKFFVVNAATAAMQISGAGNAAVVRVANVDFRRVFHGTHVAPAQTRNEGAETWVLWQSLFNMPYLCVALIETPGASLEFALDNSMSAPTHTRTGLGSAVGVVLLAQPCDGTLKLRFGADTTLASVYVQLYHGGYYGTV